MVTCSFRFSLPILFFASVLTLSARDYQLGETAEEDIRTPVRLVVVDAEATAALKEKEARRVQVIYNFKTNAINEVESAFQSTFAKTRGNFLDAVEGAYGKRTLDAEQLAATNFLELVGAFQRRNILLPVDARLAGIWAGGGSDHEIEAALTAELRRTMTALIRSDESPQDIWVGSTLRLVSLPDNETLDERIVQERGRDVPKTNFLSLPRAKAELQERFPADERALGRYVASFIKPNSLIEANLTRAIRRKRSDRMISADEIQPGQLVVRQGQIIDRKIKAALDQLREKTAPVEHQSAAVIATKQNAPATSEQLQMLMAVVSVGFLAVLLLIWRMARRHRHESLLPVRVIDAQSGSWQERALIAEQSARKAQAVVRSGLMAQLSRWLADRMTQKLITQRSELVDAHQRAALEMAELELRLEKVQAPLQERLQAYEKRIAELERELSEKDAQNRELIKAKIEVVRKQLEIQREKNRLEFN